MSAYFLLFITALGAATLLPGGSEAYLLYLKSENFNSVFLLLFATLGNTLGALINYILGKYASSWAIEKKYIKILHVKKAQGYFNSYGFFALLLSWVPIIGDPITFVAGILKYNIYKFLLLVCLAKFLRYAFLIYLFDFMQ